MHPNTLSIQQVCERIEDPVSCIQILSPYNKCVKESKTRSHASKYSLHTTSMWKNRRPGLMHPNTLSIQQVGERIEDPVSCIQILSPYNKCVKESRTRSHASKYSLHTTSRWKNRRPGLMHPNTLSIQQVDERIEDPVSCIQILSPYNKCVKESKTVCQYARQNDLQGLSIAVHEHARQSGEHETGYNDAPSCKEVPTKKRQEIEISYFVKNKSTPKILFVASSIWPLTIPLTAPY